MKKKASLSPSQAGRSLSHSVESIVSIVNQVTLIDTEKAWKELELTGSLLEPELKTVRPLDLLNYDTQSVQSIPDHNIPYQIDESDTIILNEKLCQICREQKSGEVAYPCRICTGSFHEKCLQEKGLLKSEEERSILRQAFSNIGWSCYSCANLGSLMPPDEILDLMNQFEFQDVNHDHKISIEEFMNMRRNEFRRQFGVDMSQDDLNATHLRFELIDLDKNGFIDWDEYLNYECMRRLHRRPARELVLELKPKEIQRARETFYTFDRDKSGTISEDEARRSFRHWFIFLHSRDDKPNIDGHVNVHSNLVMAAASSQTGELSWDNYIKSQAIYILVNRVNNPKGLVRKENLAKELTKKRKSTAQTIKPLRQRAMSKSKTK